MDEYLLLGVIVAGMAYLIYFENDPVYEIKKIEYERAKFENADPYIIGVSAAALIAYVFAENKYNKEKIKQEVDKDLETLGIIVRENRERVRTQEELDNPGYFREDGEILNKKELRANILDEVNYKLAEAKKSYNPSILSGNNARDFAAYKKKFPPEVDQSL
jgi:hypothetical protein